MRNEDVCVHPPVSAEVRMKIKWSRTIEANTFFNIWVILKKKAKFML